MGGRLPGVLRTAARQTVSRRGIDAALSPGEPVGCGMPRVRRRALWGSGAAVIAMAGPRPRQKAGDFPDGPQMKLRLIPFLGAKCPLEITTGLWFASEEFAILCGARRPRMRR